MSPSPKKPTKKNVQLQNSAGSRSIASVMSDARLTYKSYFGRLILAAVIVMLPSAIDSFYNSFLIHHIPGATAYDNSLQLVAVGQRKYIGLAITVLTGILGTRLGLGFISFNIQALTTKKEKPSLSLLSSISWQKLLRLVVGMIVIFLPFLLVFFFFMFVVYGSLMSNIGKGQLITLLGGLILIVILLVGILLISTRLALFQYYIVENYGPIDSIKASRLATRGSFWKILLLQVINVVLVLTGMLLLVLPVILTLPLAALISAKIFTTLRHRIPESLQALAEKV